MEGIEGGTTEELTPPYGHFALLRGQWAEMPSVPLSSAWEHRADRTAHLIEDFFERFHQTLAFVFEGRGEADREAPSPLRSLATRKIVPS